MRRSSLVVQRDTETESDREKVGEKNAKNKKRDAKGNHKNKNQIEKTSSSFPVVVGVFVSLSA